MTHEYDSKSLDPAASRGEQAGVSPSFSSSSSSFSVSSSAVSPSLQARLDELLLRTSRTFALAIPLLPLPTRNTVGLGYLLFRIADTFEDAFVWSPLRRARALDEFLFHLEGVPDFDRARATSARWLDGEEGPPTDHEGHLALLRALPEVLQALHTLDPQTREIVSRHVRRTALGMRHVVTDHDGGRVQLRTIDDLQRYCYVVAGIVGELLTELFIHDAPGLLEVEAELKTHERAFGEGLQLVNILKDERVDAREGRVFLPANVARGEVVALAERDLVQATAYVAALTRAKAPAGFVAFTGLPLELAKANLEILGQKGPGAKLTRDHVLTTFARFTALAQEEDHSASAQSGK
jgi:farnesyl-diphosphate farnesyltransferase